MSFSNGYSNRFHISLLEAVRDGRGREVDDDSAGDSAGSSEEVAGDVDVIGVLETVTVLLGDTTIELVALVDMVDDEVPVTERDAGDPVEEAVTEGVVDKEGVKVSVPLGDSVIEIVGVREGVSETVKVRLVEAVSDIEGLWELRYDGDMVLEGVRDVLIEALLEPDFETDGVELIDLEEETLIVRVRDDEVEGVPHVCSAYMSEVLK